MAAVVCFTFQIVMLFGKYRQKHSLCVLLSIYMVALSPVLAASSDRSAFIEIRTHERPGGQPKLSSLESDFVSTSVSNGESDGDVIADNIRGKFASVGQKNNANGRLHLVQLFFV